MSTPSPVASSISHAGRPVFRRTWRAVLGPGLVVMLADTDAGSIIAAARSGAQWGHRLLILQIVLIPVLFIVQELTVRLGLATQKGHGELIGETFARGWAWLSVGTLCVACVRHPTSAKYRRNSCPFHFRSPVPLPRCRQHWCSDHALDGLLPAVSRGGQGVESGQRSPDRAGPDANAGRLGRAYGFCNGAGRRGAGCHCRGVPDGSLGLGEVAGYKRSLEHNLREAPWFYAVFGLILVAGGVLVNSGIDLVKLSVAV